jgi:hypothetical protein
MWIQQSLHPDPKPVNLDPLMDRLQKKVSTYCSSVIFLLGFVSDLELEGDLMATQQFRHLEK